ncbi:hypothetical protein LIER_29598 [Lithospermum erythrorhizon]|uniref:RNase H type-1 domain-containing protein n=1 Tax=Lithospermum erythrorhizon TaxID=34254 RepID=A0AAV3RMP4_LITER
MGIFVAAAYMMIKWCVDKGYSMLVNCMGTHKGHWKLVNSMRQTSTSIESLIKREQNMAADWLAKKALQDKNQLHWLPHQMSQELKALLRQTYKQLADRSCLGRSDLCPLL